ncbi:sensor histidine kinase [Enterocloster clostridioformis]|uniref:sensor histidine kinase n=1 Tax=Enterocloster clostridioformis TaxID=1531 RepID=UPI000412E53F|nr:HAMP domain-containing sensor histidine kinase [Enterocloster clostridioformis]
MSIFRDRQVKFFSFFIAVYIVLIFGTGTWLCQTQIATAKSMYLEHDRAVVSALLEQGVSKEVIANAVSSTDTSAAGVEFLSSLGINQNTLNSLLPHFSQFQHHFLLMVLGGCIFLTLILGIGIIFFLRIRNGLYQQAEKIIDNYINNDYSCHLPQDSEGEIFHLFASVEQLATMLQAKNETEHKTKEFLKSTISDISHQLKTPLAALMMYQEIIEAEPDNAETVKEFSQKIGTALKRIEQLILSMLKITRLDTGNILFEKQSYFIQELIKNAISELTTRATQERKQIIVNGTPNQTVICDMDWTSEAIGNLVKNALDHTKAGGIIRITWESTPTMLRILVSDNGSGIAPEDIHHIFKRFYRSKYSLNTPGVGLGLPLAKSIIEGQGGLISVQSILHEGTTFSVSFLTKS